MFRGLSVSVVMPALNEEAAIGAVLREIPPWVDEVIVVDNGSTDRTAEVAADLGARVVGEPRRGYGQACLTGLAALGPADVVVFLDADHSDYPADMERLVAPIAEGRADMVVGSRTLSASPVETTSKLPGPASLQRRKDNGGRLPGLLLPRVLGASVALTTQQRAGNALACWLMRRRYSARHTDLGPFRAIRKQALDELDMDDRNFGWTIQMQIRARARGLAVDEVPVRYRQRIGRSKISGTLSGCVRAGARILETVLREPTVQPRCPIAGEQRLILFARLPCPGTTKTRLIPALGAEGAAELHRQMTLRTLAVADEFARSRRGGRGVSVEIHFTGGSAEEMAALYGADRRYVSQPPGDLGARMNAATTEALADGARSVIIIGTDCPGLDALTLDAAFTRLATADLVLGPATDGGYYLVGLREPAPDLFQSIDWGTDRVLKQSLAAARRPPLRLKTTMLHRLQDVDEPQDLAVWERAAAALPQGARLSVVIPALNEEERIGATIDAARSGASGAEVEVIVCDGGSADATIAIARSCGAAVVPGESGRGPQMNLGARIASGDLLIFLHADTILPPAYDLHVRSQLADPAVAAGAFRLMPEAPGIGMRLVQTGANLRARLLSLPYGDQAIFLRRSTFHAVGGFPEFPAMEDFEMMRRLRRVGRVAIAPAAVRTSARRWRRGGVARTTLLNQLCVAAYLAGASPSRIADWRRSSARNRAPAAAAPKPQPTRGTS